MIKLFRYETEDDPFAYGGMGEVYRAEDKLSGNTVVIKTIHTKRLGLDEKTVESFFKEAQAGFRLGYKCHHIAKVLNIGMEDMPYMAVELFDGNLSDHLGNHDLAACRDIFRQILAGVYHAHENGVVHSDLSPDNVLVKGDPILVAVSDFGLLKILETRLITRGKSLHTGGKPYYMPPAHFFDPDLIDKTTDIYALGVIYFQILTGGVLRASLTGEVAIPDNPVLHDGTPLPDSDISIVRKCCNLEYGTLEQLLHEFAPLGLKPVGTLAKWVPDKENIEVAFTENIFNGDVILFRLKDGGLHAHRLGRLLNTKKPIEIAGAEGSLDKIFLGGTEAVSEPEDDVYLLEGGAGVNDLER